MTFRSKGGADHSRTFAGTAIEDDFFVAGLGEEFLPLFLVTVEIAFGEEHGGLGDTALRPFG